MVATDFLINGRKQIELAFFHHATPTSIAAEAFVQAFAEKRRLKLTVGRIREVDPPQGFSPEEHWRNERYTFLSQFDAPVIAAHHLDDAVETWIFTSLHGHSKLIPYRRGNVVRPFLLTPKLEMLSWAKKRDLEWLEDESNTDLSYMRNLVRHKIVPEALRVNPGLRKVIMKKYLKNEGGICA